MKFTNPYVTLPRDEVIRTTIVASINDIKLLRGLDPKEGVFQTTLSILLTKLCHELRTAITNKSLDTEDYTAFHNAICDSIITLGGKHPAHVVIPGGPVFVRVPDDVLRGPATLPPAGEVNPSPVQAISGDVRRGAIRVARKSKKSPKPDDASGAFK